MRGGGCAHIESPCRGNEVRCMRQITAWCNSNQKGKLADYRERARDEGIRRAAMLLRCTRPIDRVAINTFGWPVVFSSPGSVSSLALLLSLSLSLSSAAALAFSVSLPLSLSRKKVRNEIRIISPGVHAISSIFPGIFLLSFFTARFSF